MCQELAIRGENLYLIVCDIERRRCLVAAFEVWSAVSRVGILMSQHAQADKVARSAKVEDVMMRTSSSALERRLRVATIDLCPSPRLLKPISTDAQKDWPQVRHELMPRC
jgi:hypothetical protein